MMIASRCSAFDIVLGRLPRDAHVQDGHRQRMARTAAVRAEGGRLSRSSERSGGHGQESGGCDKRSGAHRGSPIGCSHIRRARRSRAVGFPEAWGQGTKRRHPRFEMLASMRRATSGDLELYTGEAMIVTGDRIRRSAPLSALLALVAGAAAGGSQGPRGSTSRRRSPSRGLPWTPAATASGTCRTRRSHGRSSW
jgi:hypothetical protein